MSCYQVVRTCQAERSSGQIDSGSQALHKNEIQKSVILRMPKGGSISFEYETNSGSKVSTAKLSDQTSFYGNGDLELKIANGGKHSVDISREIKSLIAVIRYADGKVFWSGDLMKGGQAEERKEEVRQNHPAKRGPENSQKGHKPALDVRELRLPSVSVTKERPEQTKAVQTEPPPGRRGPPVTDPAPEIVLPKGLDVNKLRAGDSYTCTVISGPEKGTFITNQSVPTDGRARYQISDRAVFLKNEDGTYRFENLGNNKCSITAENRLQGQSTVTSLSLPSRFSVDSKKDEPGLLARPEQSMVKKETNDLRNRHELPNSTGYKAEPGIVNNMDGAQAEEFIRNHPELDVIVVVSAPWCTFCGPYEPNYISFARNNPQIAVIKIDSDINKEFNRNHSVTGLPSTLIKPAGASSLQFPISGYMTEQGMHDVLGQAQNRVPR